VGILCVLQPGEGLISFSSLIGLFAGFSQAFSQVLFGVNAKKENAELGVLSLMGFMVLLSALPYFLIGVPTLAPNANWVWVIGIAGALGLSSVLNQLARGVAYQHGTPSRLSPFLYFSVLCAGVLDWAVFGKIPNLLSIFGAGLVILGGVLKIYLRHKILQNKNRH
jgi:drug/metabolite transporter (DMT)-like permease